MTDFDGADYDVLKHRRAHRAAALLVALAVAGTILATGGGRSVGLPVFPLAAIWFADELADQESLTGGWLTSRQRALVFRWAGWFALVVLAGLAAIKWWS
jgi:hypothetical protein